MASQPPRVILCFGDSNTWGADPVTGARFPRPVRWPGVLQQELGADYHVIEEGLCGRTTVWDDPVEGDKSGLAHLPMLLASHAPVDLVVIMLGTNDLKARFGVQALDVANSAARLVKLVQLSDAGPGAKAPQVLLVSPALPVKLRADFAEMFEGCHPKARRLASRFRFKARELKCYFLDAARLIDSSHADGLHLGPPAHAALGRAVAAQVRRILA